MILSCSRRTDVPAFYAEWLGERLREGFCVVPNPFNPKQESRLSLQPEDVDAIVFWTRHARPLFPLLGELDRRGYRHYFLYTITGYDRRLEPRVPALSVALETFRELARRRPAGSVVWRYDPIVLGEAYPPEEHLLRFREIASALEGHAKRVVISLMDLYRKTERRVAEVLEWGSEVAREPEDWPGLDELLAALAGIAREHGLTIEACSEARDFSALGIERAKCIDDRLLTELFGGEWPAKKDPGQREACGCVPSRDIGVNDTCLFGCRYCYATRSHAAARRRRAEHDPHAPTI
jgi:hypothetical protein